jgi:hypothetical protein
MENPRMGDNDPSTDMPGGPGGGQWENNAEAGKNFQAQSAKRREIADHLKQRRR